MRGQAEETVRWGAIILGYRDPGPAIDLALGLMGDGIAPERLIVIANAVREPAAQTPFTTVLKRNNVGYAAAMNHGLGEAQARRWDIAVLLTHDVAVDRRNLEQLVAVLVRAPDVGAVAPILRNRETESTFSCGGGISRAGLYHLSEPTPGERDVAWVDGATVAYRVNALSQIGLLQERFFLYGEDVDVCLRLRRVGWRVVVTDAASAAHRAGYSQPGRARVYEFLVGRNTADLILAEYGLGAAMMFTVRQLRVACGRGGGSLGRRWTIVRAVWAFALRRYGPPPPSVLRGSDVVGAW